MDKSYLSSNYIKCKYIKYSKVSINTDTNNPKGGRAHKQRLKLLKPDIKREEITTNITEMRTIISIQYKTTVCQQSQQTRRNGQIPRKMQTTEYDSRRKKKI